MLALEDIKVIELGIWLAAPACGVIMADCGADVVKVEHLGSGGDPARGWTPTDSPDVNGPNYVFETMNRGKRSIALDLDHERGREVILKLVREADVFVTNLRLSTLEKLKIGYETINRINPKIIYARGTGFGPKGPERDKMGFDSIGFWARSGIMASVGEPGNLPVRMRGSLGDVSTGTCLFGGIMVALFRRQRTGLGGLVDGSLLATGAWVAAENLWAPLVNEFSMPKYPRESPPNPLIDIYQSLDGHWFYITVLQGDRYWPAICRAIGREDLSEDARFSQLAIRRKNSALVVKTLDEAFALRTMEDWGHRLDAEHIPWGAVADPKEVIEDPQMKANDYFIELDHPTFGPIRETSIPFQLDGSAVAPRKTSPDFGSSTEEILMEVGYNWADIESLKDAKVVN